jgi:hypothetical protein
MRNLTIIYRDHDLDIQAAKMLAEAMWQEFRKELVEVTSINRVQLARVDGPMSWTGFDCQFEVMVGHTTTGQPWRRLPMYLPNRRGKLSTCQLGVQQ